MEYCLVSKKEFTNDSDGSDSRNKMSPNCDAVTLPTCDSFHLADWDCWRVLCSSAWASSNVMFIFDSCACSCSDSISNTHGAFFMTSSGKAGSKSLGLSLLTCGLSYLSA